MGKTRPSRPVRHQYGRVQLHLVASLRLVRRCATARGGQVNSVAHAHFQSETGSGSRLVFVFCPAPYLSDRRLPTYLPTYLPSNTFQYLPTSPDHAGPPLVLLRAGSSSPGRDGLKSHLRGGWSGLHCRSMIAVWVMSTLLPGSRHATILCPGAPLTPVVLIPKLPRLVRE